jgi:hypothetical protein
MRRLNPEFKALPQASLPFVNLIVMANDGKDADSEEPCAVSPSKGSADK